MTRRRLLGGTICYLAAVGVVLSAAGGLRVNASPSMPIGLWREAAPGNEPIPRGSVVIACPPEDAARLAVARGYLASGDCPGGSQPLLKPVGATAGDMVVVAPGALIAPDLGPLPILPADGAGRPLESAPLGVHRVGAGEVWLLSDESPRSWDARYFGPIPRAAVRGIATPVLVRR